MSHERAQSAIMYFIFNEPLFHLACMPEEACASHMHPIHNTTPHCHGIRIQYDHYNSHCLSSCRTLMCNSIMQYNTVLKMLHKKILNHACNIKDPYSVMIDHTTCMSCRMPGPHASYPLLLSTTCMGALLGGQYQNVLPIIVFQRFHVSYFFRFYTNTHSKRHVHRSGTCDAHLLKTRDASYIFLRVSDCMALTPKQTHRLDQLRNMMVVSITMCKLGMGMQMIVPPEPK